MTTHFATHGVTGDAASRTVASIGRERRVVGQALSYWHAVRAHRPLPLLDDLDMEREPLLRGKLFLLEVGPDVEAAMFTYCGGTLSEAFGVSPVGKRPHDVLPGEVADHMLDLIRAVVDFRRPPG